MMEKRWSVFEYSLCLSRASLGKKDPQCIHTMGRKERTVFFFFTDLRSLVGCAADIPKGGVDHRPT